MVQKDQYTYNVLNFRLSNHDVPEGPSANPYVEARSAEFFVRKRILDFQKGRWNMRILKVQYTFPTQKLGAPRLDVRVSTEPLRDIVVA